MKTKIILNLTCFVPTIIGLFIWNYLPNTLAIHFGSYGPDEFASKRFVVLIIPALFFILNLIYTFIAEKYPSWLSPEYQRNIRYLFPTLSISIFLLSISNSI